MCIAISALGLIAYSIIPNPHDMDFYTPRSVGWGYDVGITYGNEPYIRCLLDDPVDYTTPVCMVAGTLSIRYPRIAQAYLKDMYVNVQSQYSVQSMSSVSKTVQNNISQYIHSESFINDLRTRILSDYKDVIDQNGDGVIDIIHDFSMHTQGVQRILNIKALYRAGGDIVVFTLYVLLICVIIKPIMALYRWHQDRCWSCGYDLKGIVDAVVCPECGTEIE